MNLLTPRTMEFWSPGFSAIHTDVDELSDLAEEVAQAIDDEVFALDDAPTMRGVTLLENDQSYSIYHEPLTNVHPELHAKLKAMRSVASAITNIHFDKVYLERGVNPDGYAGTAMNWHYDASVNFNDSKKSVKGKVAQLARPRAIMVRHAPGTQAIRGRVCFAAKAVTKLSTFRAKSEKAVMESFYAFEQSHNGCLIDSKGSLIRVGLNADLTGDFQVTELPEGSLGVMEHPSLHRAHPDSLQYEHKVLVTFT